MLAGRDAGLGLLLAVLSSTSCTGPRNDARIAGEPSSTTSTTDPSGTSAQGAVPHPAASATTAPEEEESSEAKAARVLRREAGWRGGAERLRALEDVTFRGTIRRGTIELLAVYGVSSDGYLRRSIGGRGRTSADGIDAEGGWMLDEKGEVVSLAEEAAGGLRFEIEHRLDRHVDRSIGFVPVHVERTTLDGVECDRVRLQSHADGSFIDEYVGMDGALLAMESTSPGGRTILRYADWRDIDGIRFAFREEDESEPRTTIVWSAIEVDNGFAADDFARPKPRWKPVLEEDLVLPAELIDDKLVVVQGRVNGTPASILLDSGVSHAALDQAFARSIGVTASGKFAVMGTTGDVEAQVARDVEFALGTLEMPAQDVFVVDLESIRNRTGRDFPAVVGMPLLSRLPVTIDYAKNRVILHDPERYVAPDDAVVLPARAGPSSTILIQAGFEDLEPAWFMVDSGSSGSVDLNLPYTTRNDLVSRHPHHIEAPTAGVAGTTMSRVAKCASFTLANHTFHDVPFAMATGEGGMPGWETAAGMIGAGLLSRFVVTFDLPNRRVLFRPTDAIDAPFDQDRLGLGYLVRDDRLVIDFVVAQSPAAAAGVAIGMQIVEVDGERLDASSLMRRLLKLRRAPAGTQVELGTEDGQRFLLVLKDYF